MTKLGWRANASSGGTQNEAPREVVGGGVEQQPATPEVIGMGPEVIGMGVGAPSAQVIGMGPEVIGMGIGAPSAHVIGIGDRHCSMAASGAALRHGGQRRRIAGAAFQHDAIAASNQWRFQFSSDASSRWRKDNMSCDALCMTRYNSALLIKSVM